jgi:hypothetical protein
MKDLKKHERVVARAYGGSRCARCVKERFVDMLLIYRVLSAFLTEEANIVKRVLEVLNFCFNSPNRNNNKRKLHLKEKRPLEKLNKKIKFFIYNFDKNGCFNAFSAFILVKGHTSRHFSNKS